MMNRENLQKIAIVWLLLLCFISSDGQTDETAVFVYRGRIDEKNRPPDGIFKVRAAVFDAAGGGNELVAPQTFENVEIRDGRFSVGLKIDRETVCAGGELFLQVALKSSATSFVPDETVFELPVRERLSLWPESICRPQTGVRESAPDSSSAETDVSSATIDPSLVGNNLFINNSIKPQPVANFNITGNGTVMGTLAGGVVDSQTEYRIGGLRTIYVSGGNTIVGQATGFSLREGTGNSFFGRSAGEGTSTGSFNSFFGNAAGDANGNGSNNSFFGSGAGLIANGNRNSGFGVSAGRFALGADNSFFGSSAGQQTNLGNNNSFFGAGSGLTNTFGSNNTIVGANANVGANNLSFATAVGAGAAVNASNTIALGRPDGSDTVQIYGDLFVNRLGAGGTVPVCRNNAGQLALCAALAPKTVVSSQARQIRELQDQLQKQQAQLDLLKKTLCRVEPSAELCREAF